MSRKPKVTVPDDATWVGIGEAATLTGASPSVLRKWAAADLPTRTGTGPRGSRIEVPLEVVQERADRITQGRGRPAVSAAPGTSLTLADAFTRLENLTGQMVEQGDRAARAEVRVEFLTRQVADLTAERDRLAAEVERLRATPAPEPRRGLFRRQP